MLNVQLKGRIVQISEMVKSAVRTHYVHFKQSITISSISWASQYVTTPSLVMREVTK